MERSALSSGEASPLAGGRVSSSESPRPAARPVELPGRRRAGWRVAALVVLAAALLLAFHAELPAQGLPTSAQDPVAGSRVFGAKGCVRCHAIDGLGGTVGPDLGRIPRPRSFYDLASAMWNHLPAMLDRMRQLGIHRPRLDSRELGDLVAFLYTVDYFDQPGERAVGRRLFTEKRCILCHQAGGVGGVVGPNLDPLAQAASPIFVAAAMWNHGPAMAAAMRARGIERPTFTGRELANLLAFLKGPSPGPAEQPVHVLPGRPEEGRRLFTAKRCVECHRAGGAGGRVGPDLAGRGAGRTLTEFAAAMWNKAPKMTAAMEARRIALPELTAEEMADIVAYLSSLRYFGDTGDPRRGRALLSRKGCTGCHAARGTGGRTAPDLARLKGLDSPPGVVAALWNHAFVMEHRAERRDPAWPTLSPEEMADVVSYFTQPRGAP